MQPGFAAYIGSNVTRLLARAAERSGGEACLLAQEFKLISSTSGLSLREGVPPKSC